MNTRDKWIMGIVLGVAFALLTVPFGLNAVDELDWSGILPHIYSGATGDGAINIAYTASTVGWDVSEESALTNTVQEIMSLTHTTSGTPANGIGLEWAAKQETSASNTETIGAVQFYMSDVTAASEDASFGVELMAGGSAKAEVFTIGSTGIVSLAGAAALDNSTAATELNITETNIQLTGALDLEGGNVKINEDSGDYDFAIETDSTDNAFSIDSGNSTLDVNGLKVTFNQGSADVDFTVESNDVADAFEIDAGTNIIENGTWSSWEIVSADTVSYSISASSRAHYVMSGYSDTGAQSIILQSDLDALAGVVFTICDEDLNAGSNNITVSTASSATINEAATYAIDANGECVTLISDGTNYFAVSGIAE